MKTRSSMADLWGALGRSLEGIDALAPILPHLVGVAALLPSIVAQARAAAEGVDPGVAEGAREALGPMIEEATRRATAVVDGLWASEESLLVVVERVAQIAQRAAGDPRVAAALKLARDRAAEAADAAIERAVTASFTGGEQGGGRGLAMAEAILQQIVARVIDGAFPAARAEDQGEGPRR